jgi:phenylalanyl-tRNA synthetase beta chain
MKLSLNWIKQFTDVDVPVDELVAKIGAQLGEVEGVENLSPKYEGAVIVKVVSCGDHPNADRLHVCRVDDGGAVKDAERDEDGHVQVVCGAPNVHADMLAVWLPPGATVPDSYDQEPFVLEARELRGVVSNGMLASPKELALGDSHEGILEIDAKEWSPNQKDIKPGVSFAKVFGLDDAVIDIENKMFTHRPDLFGELGLAREVAGILGKPFESPKWYKDKADFPQVEGLELDVINEAPELVPRLMTLAMKEVTVKPSPLWLQCQLLLVGQKPINNIVDVTNYIMLLTGQPTHAYDYDKLRGHKLMSRMAKPGEKITLLNHKEYQLDQSDIVIADGEGPIGLAGIMGGGDSEVSSDTKSVVLECANFDMYNLRRSSMKHGIFTDALTRFNKGQSPLQNPNVLHLLMQSIQDVAGGEVASQVFDVGQVHDREWVHPPVPVTAEFINARLGLALKPDDMKQLLENVEMSVETDGDKLTVTAPFWRTDIETREDVVEEVGRLYGYDKLPLDLPLRSVKPVDKDPLLALKHQVRENLAASGANEVLTYSFVHGDLLKKAGQDPAKAFRVSNALSPELQYYRLSLTASLLDKVHPNIKAGYDNFSLFEIGKGHNTDQADKDGLPVEFEMLELVTAATDKAAPAGAAYYQALRYLTELTDALGIDIELRPIEKPESFEVAKPYDHARAAQVWVRGADIPLGMVGEYKAAVRRNFKLPTHTAGFGVGLTQLQQAIQQTRVSSYVPLPRFPKVIQDITLRVPADVPYRQVYETVWSGLMSAQPVETLPTLSPLGVYRAKDDISYKNISFRLTISSYQKTMTDAEVSVMLDAAAKLAHDQFGAEKV